jgi:hypothetical protein
MILLRPPSKICLLTRVSLSSDFGMDCSTGEVFDEQEFAKSFCRVALCRWVAKCENAVAIAEHE